MCESGGINKILFCTHILYDCECCVCYNAGASNNVNGRKKRKKMKNENVEEKRKYTANENWNYFLLDQPKN